ncbi:MAG TPA: ABC transporter ATP-binding protein [Chryseosolibacter sp.]|nr:ABC transporter ATP-binding protein [Chryseosolibacter sp.]
MNNPYFSMLRTAWKYARHEKRRFILIYSMFVVANIIVAMNPLFYGWFVTQLQKHGTEVLSTAWIYAVGYLALRLLEWTMHGPARVMEQQLAFNVSRNFQEELYQNILQLPAQWHQENHSGATISKSRKAHEALRAFFQNGFIYLYSFGKFVFSFGAMLYFSPIFGGIGIALGFVTILIIVQFDKVFIKSLREVNEKEHHVSSTLFDTLSNIMTVITLRLEKVVHASFLQKLGEVFPPFKRNATVNEWKWFTAQMMIGLIYAVTVLGYVYQQWIPGQTFEIGGLIILIGYVTQFTSVFNDIASQYTQIVKYHTDVQNVKEIEEAIAEAPRVKEEKTLPAEWQYIDIEDLNFIRRDKNATNKPTGLFDLSMRIEKGQRIALIGESGSGKSTLLSLLRGLHDPLPGSRISVNDSVPISMDHINSSVTLLPQEPEIFENTVLYNITLGLPFSREEVMDVCEQAQFTDVLKKLPEGLDTFIQEKGVNLSGGQKQRLALARGILAARSSDIVLMDEPTSSVDPRTEKMVYANMFDTFKGKSVISSLHRLHLLTQFDYIYILRNGQVVDEGTFDHLNRYSLVFQEMWAHQKAEVPQEVGPYPQMNVAL